MNTINSYSCSVRASLVCSHSSLPEAKSILACCSSLLASDSCSKETIHPAIHITYVHHMHNASYWSPKVPLYWPFAHLPLCGAELKVGVLGGLQDCLLLVLQLLYLVQELLIITHQLHTHSEQAAYVQHILYHSFTKQQNLFNGLNICTGI